VVPEVRTLAASEVASRLADGDLVVVDLATSKSYRAGHIPGARFLLRSELLGRLRDLPERCLVLTSPDGALAAFAVAELLESGGLDPAVQVHLLDGGTDAWRSAGYELEVSEQYWVSSPLDCYQRPYEGTDNDPAAMQAYLDWEYGLVGQLHRDESHGFSVLESDN
jgi:rhodanese-related sulfurtransferase